MASEHAAEGRRGFCSIFPRVEPAAGFLLPSGLFLARALPGARWSWRTPFLFGMVLVLVGPYVGAMAAFSFVFVLPPSETCLTDLAEIRVRENAAAEQPRPSEI